MKLLYLLSIMATVVTAVKAGNSEYLRGPDYDPASDAKQFDFSNVNQAEQSANSACPKKCPLGYQPVKDKDGVVHQNKCIQRLLECTDSLSISASDFSDLRRIFGTSIEGTIELNGSSVSTNVVYAEVPDELMENPPTNPKGFAEELLMEIVRQSSQRKEGKP
ncbi:hypothetical protein PC129_g713 [Phytophthora cactorum]|uniref:Uncharacterized protein n=2 Tax=Phytophthora cactorum TaxID=29920 RepID=A0A8T1EI74_9STRA|nr:hypothetical protein Pcac1_g2059 [Phytophthora cactorum]KAG2845763.1 hypothetical protein PC111_g1453 [Phytophthora cactorum]KAG2930997.1 hypothetical protein PC114_g2311 [Phytophthora cactorum]KAG2952933.1 hypothetical protein PC117_g2394 [Phytophthora cactorum]KAG3022360.1 hypothetical protein PC120_g8169 [Phytophthora cactorum]